MPDNITAPGVGTVLASDEIGGVHFPRSKVVFGADGTATDVSPSNPLPVVMPSAQAVTGTFWPTTQPVSIAATVAVSGPLTDTQLRASAVPVSGNVGIAGPVAVTGTFFQPTQPISAASLPLPTGAATQDTLAALLAKVIAAPATEAKQDANTAAIFKLGSGKRWFAITPADSALATVPDAVYVGGAGNIVARGSDGVDATFAVVAGQTISISPTQVRTGTTATGLIGLIS